MASPINWMRPLWIEGIRLANGMATTVSLASTPSRFNTSFRTSINTPAPSCVLESI